MPENNNHIFGNDSPESVFTPQTTVGQVITDPAFGDFGRLLFPVDRNVSPSMTLSDVSSTDVYMWYPYIRVEKTVEVLNPNFHAFRPECSRVPKAKGKRPHSEKKII